MKTYPLYLFGSGMPEDPDFIIHTREPFLLCKVTPSPFHHDFVELSGWPVKPECNHLPAIGQRMADLYFVTVLSTFFDTGGGYRLNFTYDFNPPRWLRVKNSQASWFGYLDTANMRLWRKSHNKFTWVPDFGTNPPAARSSLEVAAIHDAFTHAYKHSVSVLV